MGAILLLGCLGSLFFITYLGNQKTPVPNKIKKVSHCHHCQITSCTHYKGGSCWDKLSFQCLS